MAKTQKQPNNTKADSGQPVADGDDKTDSSADARNYNAQKLGVTKVMGMTGHAKRVNKKPLFVLGGILLVVVVGGLIFVTGNREPDVTATQDMKLANDAYIEGNKDLALEHAKQALEKDPNNNETILLVAKLTNAKDPQAAKQYYLQAFNLYAKQFNPDAPGKTATVYWAAADLARRAGKTEQAKEYYAKVAPAANENDGYEQNIAKQSKDWLARLQ